MTFTFGPTRSLFTRAVSYNGWPAVWKVTDFVEGLDSSCGNSNQRQFDGNVIDGVYLKKEGKWYYVTNH